MPAQILITGASGGNQGATGNRLAKRLLSKDIPVRAFVHREDKRSDQLRAAGAEVFSGDLLEIQSVRTAMKGIQSVFFCYPVRAGLLEAAAIMAQVAKEEDAKFILNLSQGAASDQSPSPTARRHWLTERLFDWSGTPVLHLRGGVFFENLFRQFAKGIREDSELRAPFGSGEGKIPVIAGQDIARFAAVALKAPDRFAGKILPLFGVVLSLLEIADAVSETIGRTIRYREVSPEKWTREARLREGEENPDQIDHLVTLWKGILLLNQDESLGPKLAGVSTLFRDITGEAPLTPDDWLKDEAGQRALQGGGLQR